MMAQENQKLNVLCHHGVKGQEWGNRRYQYEDGSLTEEGRKHWGIGPPREKRKSFRLESAEDKQARLERKAAKKQEKIVNKKIKLINSGDRNKIYKNRKLFTDEELQYAERRINAAEKFNTKPAKEPKEKQNFIKKQMINSGDLEG